MAQAEGQREPPEMSEFVSVDRVEPTTRAWRSYTVWFLNRASLNFFLGSEYGRISS